MSKIPPQLRESLSALLQITTAFAFRHLPGPRGLEDFLAGTQHFVQCFLKVRGTLGQLLSHLRNILFEALFYLLSKELLERPVAKSFRVFGGMVGDDVRNEGACEPLRALIRILGEKRVQRTSCPTVARCRG